MPTKRPPATPGLQDMFGGEPHYFGHRERLRERLFEAGAKNLPDYELLEVLLFTHDPRKDVKELAKALIARFGSFAEVLSASPEALRAAKLRDTAIANLMAAREAALRLGKTELQQRSVLNSWDKLIAYCNAHIARNTVEEFHLLFLNNKNELIAHERQGRGTINHTPVYVREVAKRALELGASALIMVHNHPSGDPAPSAADIATTQEVSKAIKPLGVTVHDHLVIGRRGHVSLRDLGVI
jgi:DNA repair protein RadC